ncbi:hypothetical protein [Silvanigrella sp.]|jgi:hypothetical protein
MYSQTCIEYLDEFSYGLNTQIAQILKRKKNDGLFDAFFISNTTIR